MDPLTLFSYVPLAGIVVFLIALVVAVAIVVKIKRQSAPVLLSDKRIFPLLLVAIVLVVGLGVSTVLVRRQQETRTEAYVPCEDNSDCDTACGEHCSNNRCVGRDTTLCPPPTPTPTPTPNKDQCQECYDKGEDCVASITGGDCVPRPPPTGCPSECTYGCAPGTYTCKPPPAQGCQITGSCGRNSCTVTNNSGSAVDVFFIAAGCPGNMTGLCSGGPEQPQGQLGAGQTKTYSGGAGTNGCGSWQTDVTAGCFSTSASGTEDSSCNPTPTPTPPGVVDAACAQVVADKTLSTLKPGDTVNFTGYGWVDKSTDSIDQINFIISKDGAEVSNTDIPAVRASEKDVAGQYYYKANRAYTIATTGSYSVKIRVHWVGGNIWRD